MTRVKGTEAASGAGMTILMMGAILLLPLAALLPLVVWKAIMRENIPELNLISFCSVGLTAFVVLKNRLDFSTALAGGIIGIDGLFSLLSSLLTFVSRPGLWLPRFPSGSFCASFSSGSLPPWLRHWSSPS